MKGRPTKIVASSILNDLMDCCVLGRDMLKARNLKDFKAAYQALQARLRSLIGLFDRGAEAPRLREKLPDGSIDNARKGAAAYRSRRPKPEVIELPRAA